MSKIYDDWERLVAAVLRREDDRRVALDSSRDPSFNSSDSSSLNFGASSGVHDPDFDRILPSYHLRHVISKPRTAAGYESKKDLHDSSISHSDRGKKVGYELKKDLRDSSIPLSDRGKRAGYEWKEDLHDSSISHSDRGKRAGYESKEDLHDSSISHSDRGKKVGYELKKDPRDSSISLSDRGKKAGYESREDLHNKSSNFDADSSKKKVVIKIEMHDDREKQKAMKAISGLPGIDSVAMIMKEKKMTIVGDFDPIHAVSKLRKMFPADIITIGPAKELQENKIDVKEIRRKNQIEVDERKKVPSDEGKSEQVAELVKHYQSYYPYNMQQYYHTYVPENDPNSCVIS